MLRIGICDDEENARFAMRCALERVLETREIECSFYEFSAGDRLLDWYAKHPGELDVVFLDIEMAGTNGMDTARRLRAADKNLQIAFSTGYRDYVFDGYEVGALGYLMKPPDTEKLVEIVTRAIAALHLSAQDTYLCHNSEGIYRIPKSSIRYFCSDRRLITCVADGRSYTFYGKLDEVEEDVGKPFVRIHQRYLVNPSAVERIEGSAVVTGGEKLPISRNLQKEATLALTRAMLA
ncbi:MAG: LytR/AlgR family response regulator transcription factor [Oscillospiraceae bacterium]